MLGLAVKVASLFMAKAISGRVALARYCNLPNSYMNGLLWLLSESSVFASMGTFGSSSVATGFDLSMSSHFSIASIYLCCDIVIESGPHEISIPIIFCSSPRSIICHQFSSCSFIRHIPTSEFENMSRSSTQIIIICRSFDLHCTYVHGSECNHVNPISCRP